MGSGGHSPWPACLAVCSASYRSKVVKALAREMLAEHAAGARPSPPFAFIVRDNVNSLSLFESLGFVRSETVRWCRFE